MMKTLLLLLSVLVLAPVKLHAFYSVAEMDVDLLKKNPFIKTRVIKSADQITFFVVLAMADNHEVYWHGSLDIIDTKGELLARVEMRGEDIHRSLDERTLQNWGWQNFSPAEVFRFTVESKMVAHSKFTWETGPRSNEQGIEYGGGIIRWSYLQNLADVAEDAKKISAANGNPPSGPPLRYHNARFGLTFYLPADWRNFTISIQEVEDTNYSPDEDKRIVVGQTPMITLQHPQSQANVPYQDIPILVFTRAQWDALHQGELWPLLFTGGVMDELWHNQEYVFAMSSRYNAHDEIKGWKEVADIIELNRAANAMARLYPQ